MAKDGDPAAPELSEDGERTEYFIPSSFLHFPSTSTQRYLKLCSVNIAVCVLQGVRNVGCFKMQSNYHSEAVIICLLQRQHPHPFKWDVWRRL